MRACTHERVLVMAYMHTPTLTQIGYQTWYPWASAKDLQKYRCEWVLLEGPADKPVLLLAAAHCHSVTIICMCFIVLKTQILPGCTF